MKKYEMQAIIPNSIVEARQSVLNKNFLDLTVLTMCQVGKESEDQEKTSFMKLIQQTIEMHLTSSTITICIESIRKQSMWLWEANVTG